MSFKKIKNVKYHEKVFKNVTFLENSNVMEKQFFQPLMAVIMTLWQEQITNFVS